MLNKLIMWGLFILPWVSIFFMKRECVKRFTPVVITTALVITFVDVIAYVFKWWTALDTIVPWGHIVDVYYSYGLFLVGTFWVFRLTFRRFWLYMLLNTCIGLLWVLAAIPFLESVKIIHLVNVNRWQLLIIHFVDALIAYGYQLWHEKAFELKFLHS